MIFWSKRNYKDPLTLKINKKLACTYDLFHIFIKQVYNHSYSTTKFLNKISTEFKGLGINYLDFSVFS